MAVDIFGLLALTVVLFAGTGVTSPTCCDFESSNTCTAAWLTGGFYWFDYPRYPPSLAGLSYPIPSGSGYLWSQGTTSATLFSSDFYGVNSATTFNFNFWGDLNSPLSYLEVYFVPDAYPSTAPLFLGTQTYGSWRSSGTIYCATFACCGAGVSTCNGRLEFVAVFDAGDHGLFAVDDVQSDNGCSSTPCCTFAISGTCGWAVNDWQWSGNAPPVGVYPPPPSSGYYEWFQVTSGGSAPPNSILQSPYIYVNAATYFTVSYYVDLNPLVAANSLYVYFRQDGFLTRTQVAYLYTTDGGWVTATLKCSDSVVGTCCASGSTCYGYLEFDASGAYGDVFYAIDSVSVSGGCF